MNKLQIALSLSQKSNAKLSEISELFAIFVSHLPA